MPPRQSDECHARAEARSRSGRRCCLPFARRRRYEPTWEAACADGFPLRSPSLRRVYPVAACWCPPPTARPPRRRWPRASSRLPASRRCTTRPAPTWPAGSPRRYSMPLAAAARLPVRSGCSRSDELWLDRLAGQLHPRVVVLANLFRDQLDRYGELETIAERWAGAVRAGGPAERARLVCNADDPLVADLGRERAPGDHEPAISTADGPKSDACLCQATTSRPISTADGPKSDACLCKATTSRPISTANGPKAKASLRKATTDRPTTTTSRPASCTTVSRTTRWRCGHGSCRRRQALPSLRCAVRFDAVYLGHLGHYHCRVLRSAAALRPRVRDRSVVLEGVRSARFHADTPEGEAEVESCAAWLYNVYNALAASRACQSF